MSHAGVVWEEVFPLLSPRDILNLRCTGSKVLDYYIERRKTVNLFCKNLPSSWPSSVHADSPIRRLSMEVEALMTGALPKHLKDLIDVTKMPRNLRILELRIYTPNLPFIYYDASYYRQCLDLINDSLPNLEDLTVVTSSTGGYFVMPSSVTRFAGQGATCLELPPKIRDLYIHRNFNTGLLSHLPRSLERLVAFHPFQLSELPSLPFITEISVYVYPSDPIKSTRLEDKLPALTKLNLTGELKNWKSCMPPQLTYLSTQAFIAPSDYKFLPPKLTKLLCYNDLVSCDLESIGDLPRSLLYLRLNHFLAPKLIPTNLVDTFPSGLTALDLRCTALDGAKISQLPLGLTSLFWHNLTSQHVHRLERFRHLGKLGLFWGTLTSKIAKNLPRRLHSLTLCYLALRTKGRYQIPGVEGFVHYSATNPQLTPLDHLPPLLHTLYIQPHPTSTFFHLNVFNIISRLPKLLSTLSLEVSPLRLILPEYAHSPVSDRPDTPTKALQYHPPRCTVSEAFANFKNLNHLHFPSDTDERTTDSQTLLDSLPPTVTAAHIGNVGTLKVPPHVRYFHTLMPHSRPRHVQAYNRYSDCILSSSRLRSISESEPSTSSEYSYDYN